MVNWNSNKEYWKKTERMVRNSIGKRQKERMAAIEPHRGSKTARH